MARYKLKVAGLDILTKLEKLYSNEGKHILMLMTVWDCAKTENGFQQSGSRQGYFYVIYTSKHKDDFQL